MQVNDATERFWNLLMSRDDDDCARHIKRLMESDADINKSMYGLTPLAFACEANMIATANIIIDSGLLKNDKQALRQAIICHHVNIVERLLDFGTSMPEYPFWCVINAYYQSFARQSSDTKKIIRLLFLHDAKIKQPSKKNIDLYVFVKKLHFDNITLLVRTLYKIETACEQWLCSDGEQTRGKIIAGLPNESIESITEMCILFELGLGGLPRLNPDIVLMIVFHLIKLSFFYWL